MYKYVVLILSFILAACSTIKSAPNLPSQKDGQCYAELRWCDLEPDGYFKFAKYFLDWTTIHTYWLVNDGSTDWIISGRPSNMYDGSGTLDVKVWQLWQSDTCKESVLQWSSGKSPAYCQQVKDMLSAAHTWPVTPYEWWDTNCNSATRYLGGVGGFDEAIPPKFPWAYGWNNHISGLDD